MPLIWGQRKAEYFSLEDWTTQISLIRLAKFDFARNPDGDAATRPRRVKFGIEERQASSALPSTRDLPAPGCDVRHGRATSAAA